MKLYEMVESFKKDDLLNTDRRRLMEVAFSMIARFYFEDLYEEDMSSVESIVNANYYQLAKEKLYGYKEDN